MPTIDTIKFDELATTLVGVLEAAGSTALLDLQAVWTTGEVCSYFRIGRDTLREYMARGLPHIRLGQGYRFERLRVKKWFKDGKASD